MLQAAASFESFHLGFGGQIDVRDGGDFRTANASLLLSGGTLRGSFRSLDSVNTISGYTSKLVDLADFEGVLNVQRGRVQIETSTPSTPFTIHVASSSGIELLDETNINGSIFLQDAVGDDLSGAIRSAYDSAPVISGPVHLGENGSLIGGHRQSSLEFAGPLSGGGVTFLGQVGQHVYLTSADNTYFGHARWVRPNE